MFLSLCLVPGGYIGYLLSLVQIAYHQIRCKSTQEIGYQILVFVEGAKVKKSKQNMFHAI